MRTFAVCFAGLALFFAACGGGSQGTAMKDGVAEELPAETVQGQAIKQRKLIRTAEIDLLVDNAESSSDQIASMARSLGGFVAASTIEKGHRRAGARLVLRVPESRFDDALDALKGLAKEVARKSVVTEDVTGRYVDLEARRRSLQLTESELEKLLAESRAQKRSAVEIVAIYKELTEIRTQREQVQGQKQSLDGRIALATIRVALFLDRAALAAAEPAWKPLETVESSFTSLVKVLKVLAEVVIFIVIVVLPVLILVLIPSWWMIRRFRKGRTN